MTSHPDRRLRLLAGCAVAAIALAPLPAFAQLTAMQGGTQTAGGSAPIIVQTPGFTDVTLQASRTIITWTAYSLGANDTVLYRFGDASGIVLNRVNGSALIDGQVEGLVGSTRRQGNVWYSAPGGVIIGGNARVNVGGLFATAGTVDTSDFLNVGSSQFRVTGAGSGSVQVSGGADVRTGGGAIALISGSVSTGAGATLQAGTAFYGAANDYTVRFAPVAGGLDLLDFIVPAGGGTGSSAPLTLGAQSLAGTVVAAVVNRAEVASAVISAPGLIAAQTALGAGGDVILTAGVDVLNKLPGATRTNSTTNTGATFGVVSAQRDVAASFSQPTTLTATQISTGRDLGIITNALDVGSMNAGRSLGVNAMQSILIRNSASSGAAAMLATPGALNVGGGIDALGRLQIDAGTVQAGRLSSGRSVTVNSNGAAVGSGANLAAVNIGTLIAEDDVTLLTTAANGSIILGNLTITGARNDDNPVGRNLSVTTRGASADITYGGAGGAALVGPTSVALSSGRDLTMNVQGNLLITSGAATRAFLIRAGDLQLAGPLTAASLRIESLVGALTLGGATGNSGLNSGLSAGVDGLAISDTEFQRITVTGDSTFLAGSSIGAARGDLTVRDLSVTPSRTPRIILGAGTANDVLVTGAFAPTVTGGAVVIGDPNDAGFRPGRILISGSIGASSGDSGAGFTGVRAFNTVALNAQRDVIMGSPRFIALVANADPDTVDIARNQPAGVATAAADEQGRIFITAGSLGITGTVRILQQNTGTAQTPNGLFLPNQATPVENVLTVTPAQVVDLFGAFRDANGVVQGGLRAGAGGGVFIDGLQTPGVRFNGCELAAGCGGTTVQTTLASTVQVLALAPQSPSEQAPAATASSDTASNSEESQEDEDSAESEAAEARGPAGQPPLMTVAQPDLSAEISDPVIIGAGSDELWRSRAAKKKPPQ